MLFIQEITKKLAYPALMIAVVLTVSCGDPGSSDLLPLGSYVNISPAGKQWTVGAALCDGSNIKTSYHTVSVRNADHQVLLGVPVSLSMDLTASNSTGITPLELYVDENRNNIPDASELVSNNLAGSYDTDTSKTDGTLKIIVKMDVSCIFRGLLTVQAGDISGTTDFSSTLVM